MKPDYDLFIIGGGIAGLALALTCRTEGLSCLVFNDPDKPSAANASGGLLNPIPGKSFAPAWRASTLFPYAETFFKHWASALDSPFYQSREILRLTSSQRARKVLRRLQNDPDAAALAVSTIKPTPPFPAVGERGQPLSWLSVSGGGTLDTRQFVEVTRRSLEASASLVHQAVFPGAISSDEHCVQLGGKSASFAVFCEGRHAAANPAFPDLRLEAVKGELLTLHLPKLTFDDRVHIQAHWLFQSAPQVFQLGATYTQETCDAEPTKAAAEDLLGSLRRLLPASALDGLEVLEHRAGFRPSSADRRPYVGRSPLHPRFAILTGLGSKGCSQAPWLAKQLLNHLFQNAPQDKTTQNVFLFGCNCAP